MGLRRRPGFRRPTRNTATRGVTPVLALVQADVTHESGQENLLQEVSRSAPQVDRL
jgi:hypothetical protein